MDIIGEESADWDGDKTPISVEFWNLLYTENAILKEQNLAMSRGMEAKDFHIQQLSLKIFNLQRHCDNLINAWNLDKQMWNFMLNRGQPNVHGHRDEIGLNVYEHADYQNQSNDGGLVENLEHNQEMGNYNNVINDNEGNAAVVEEARDEEAVILEQPHDEEPAIVEEPQVIAPREAMNFVLGEGRGRRRRARHRRRGVVHEEAHAIAIDGRHPNDEMRDQEPREIREIEEDNFEVHPVRMILDNEEEPPEDRRRLIGFHQNGLRYQELRAYQRQQAWARLRAAREPIQFDSGIESGGEDV